MFATSVTLEELERQILLERERCAKIADDMRVKHGSPVGDAYKNGVWDQGVRIAAIIRDPTPG